VGAFQKPANAVQLGYLLRSPKPLLFHSQMDKTFRQRVIDALHHNEPLPLEWERVLFPPERREPELVYSGKEREEDILGDTMSVPLQAVSTFGKRSDGWHNKLIFGDNLQAMKTLLQLKERGELCNADGTPGVRLIYIDPPFATKREFRGTQDQRAYQDKIAGAAFLEFLRERLVLLRELLADDGTIYVHLDSKKVHYVKVLMDEIVGESNFKNEIIWYYWNKFQMRNMGAYARNHDTLLVYSKAKVNVFNPQATKLDSPKKLKRIYWDAEKGRIQNVKDKHGKVVYKEVTDEKIDDIWDIPYAGTTAKERTGYPTQKPEALLERVIATSSNRGDLVMDAFAGSGTTVAVAEKLDRRWIAVDCGKLAIYTIQKRLLNLKNGVGNTGTPFTPQAFTLYNAGLYDFATLRALPWTDWRFFALQLFGCKDEPHEIGGLHLDGKLKGSSVLVFNYQELTGRHIDEETIRDIHLAIGKQTGRRFFVIAPRGSFDFQQDYLDFDGVRYYALRIPYSIINELHSRSFTALEQPRDEAEINATVDAVGFDFIHPPRVRWLPGRRRLKGMTSPEAIIRIRSFSSTTRVGGVDQIGGLETFAMLMLDLDYKGEVFELDQFYLADELQKASWQVSIPAVLIGKQVMAVFIDIYGNESRELIPRPKFGLSSARPAKVTRTRRQHAA
jgi:DNA modification methylase